MIELAGSDRDELLREAEDVLIARRRWCKPAT